MAYSDRELLARLIECEAGGEGNEGMAAVASVVMNRVYTPYWRIFKSFKRWKYQKYNISKRTVYMCNGNRKRRI